ncbi:MAG: hypothetical protein RL226_773 [Bacteroidota bacterium]|jgi:hypothetical protein
MRILYLVLLGFIVACTSPAENQETTVQESLVTRPIKIGNAAGNVNGYYINDSLVRIEALVHASKGTESETFLFKNGSAQSAICVSPELTADSTIVFQEYSFTLQNESILNLQSRTAPSREGLSEIAFAAYSGDINAIQKRYVGKLKAYLIALEMKRDN